MFKKETDLDPHWGSPRRASLLPLPPPAWVPRAQRAQQVHQGLTDQESKERKKSTWERKPAQLALNELLPESSLRPISGDCSQCTLLHSQPWGKWYLQKKRDSLRKAAPRQKPHFSGISSSISLGVSLSLKYSGPLTGPGFGDPMAGRVKMLTSHPRHRWGHAPCPCLLGRLQTTQNVGPPRPCPPTPRTRERSPQGGASRRIIDLPPKSEDGGTKAACYQSCLRFSGTGDTLGNRFRKRKRSVFRQG